MQRGGGGVVQWGWCKNGTVVFLSQHRTTIPPSLHCSSWLIVVDYRPAVYACQTSRPPDRGCDGWHAPAADLHCATSRHGNSHHSSWEEIVLYSEVCANLVPLFPCRTVERTIPQSLHWSLWPVDCCTVYVGSMCMSIMMPSSQMV
jgi:hypothetical protein